jgi:hypothetical protein
MEINEFACRICGLHYKDKELSEKCYAWCSTHDSCNLEIAMQSVEAIRSRNQKNANG